jgi:hypothetical protein
MKQDNNDEKDKTMCLILCISDGFGVEQYCGFFHDVDLDEYNNDDEDEDCDNIFSLFKVNDDDWLNKEETWFNEFHPSFWLARHGKELCFGDYV